MRIGKNKIKMANNRKPKTLLGFYSLACTFPHGSLQTRSLFATPQPFLPFPYLNLGSFNSEPSTLWPCSEVPIFRSYPPCHQNERHVWINFTHETYKNLTFLSSCRGDTRHDIPPLFTTGFPRETKNTKPRCKKSRKQQCKAVAVTWLGILIITINIEHWTLKKSWSYQSSS